MTPSLGLRPLASRPAVTVALVAAALAGCSSSSPGAGGGGGGGGGCTLPPASPLTVVQVVPANGATGVFVGTDVSVRFNTCLDPATITSTNIMLASFGVVAGSLGYDAATATVTFHPSANLAYGTIYILGITTGVKGAHGETMATAFGSAFTTQAAPDTTPPTTAAVPPGGYYNATQSVALACTDNVGGTGCAATYYTVDGNTPTLLSPRYTAPIAIAASTTLRFFSVDVQGNAESPKQEVYVIDTVPPTLTGSDPANGATGVAVTKVITATFSEAMKASTFTSVSVTLDNGVTASLSYAAATNTLTIAPTERLACNTLYHVAVTAAATDLAGNGLVQPATFSFTTTTDCIEPVTSASVPGGVYTAAQSVTLTCTDAGGSGCARMVYTTDGSVPSLDPPTNGTIVAAASAGPIAVGQGDTVLRYFSEDAAGNREVLRQQTYSISIGQGFTFVATDGGLARGVGAVPASFVSIWPGGTTYAFFRDPGNNRLYRGTQNGLFVSDGGEAWTLLNASMGAVASVFAQGSKIFAGTFGNGLYVSTDGGATFIRRNIVATYPYVYSILASGYQVYVATDSGLAVSSDKGQTFALRTTADGLGSSSVRNLIATGGVLYAATGGGVSISTDGGTTFANYATGLASPSVNALAVSGSTVYAATNSGLSISYDGGHTFTATRTTSNGLGSDYVDVLLFDGSKLYVSTGDPVLSGTTNSFAISTDASGATFTPHAVSPSHPLLQAGAIQVEGLTVRVGAYPAYYLSNDGGLTFVPKDLRGPLSRIAGSGTALYLAVRDSFDYGGVAISTDRGQSFTFRDAQDGLPAIGGTVDVSDVAAAGTNVYVATFAGLGVSTNGGTSFSLKTIPSVGSNVECLWASGPTVWAGTGSTLDLSTNSGSTFTQKLSGTATTTGIAASGSNVFLATSNGLWVSTDGGNTFPAPNPKLGAQGLGNTGLSGVAVDSSGTVLAVSNSSGGPTGFYSSSTNGASFTPLPGPALFAYGIYAYGTTWYVSTYNGLGISSDGGATWAWRGTAQGVQGATHGAWYMP